MDLSIGIIAANNNGSDYEFDNVSVKEVGQDWVFGTGWSMGDNKATFTAGGAQYSQLEQNKSLGNSKNFNVSFDLVDPDNLGVYVRLCSGSWSSLISGTGTKNLTSSSSTGSQIEFEIGPGYATKSLSIGNISIKEVAQNWQLGAPTSGWSVENGKLKSNNAGNYLALQPNILTSGNTYEIKYTISDFAGGTFGIRAHTSAGITATADGTYTDHIVSNGSHLYLLGFTTFVGKVDNISVKDVTFSEDVDLARINYDTSGQNGHILLEPTRTNNLTASQDLTDNFWAVGARVKTVVASTVLSPDGETFSYKVIPTTSTSTKYIDYGFGFLSMPSGVEVTYSIFAKPFGYTNFQLAPSTGFGSRFQNFELTGDGVLGTGDVNGATIEKIGDYYRCSITETTAGTTPRVLNIALPSSGVTLSRNPTFAGNGTDGVLLWGAQLEQGNYPTSYIPNLGTVNGSTVTRAAETLNGSGNTTLINSTEGVLFAEIAALANDGTYREISLNDGTTNNVVEIRYTDVSDQLQFVVRSTAGGVIVNKTFALGTAGALQFNKIAFSYKSNDYKMYVNGVQVDVDTTGAMPSGLTTLSFDWGGNNDFYGKCKQLALFNEALEDDELELLTGITNFSSFDATASGGGYTII